MIPDRPTELFEQCYFACVRMDADGRRRKETIWASFRMSNGEWCRFDVDAIDCKRVRSVGR